MGAQLRHSGGVPAGAKETISSRTLPTTSPNRLRVPLCAIVGVRPATITNQDGDDVAPEQHRRPCSLRAVARPARLSATTNVGLSAGVQSRLRPVIPSPDCPPATECPTVRPSAIPATPQRTATGAPTLATEYRLTATSTTWAPLAGCNSRVLPHDGWPTVRQSAQLHRSPHRRSPDADRQRCSLVPRETDNERLRRPFPSPNPPVVSNAFPERGPTGTGRWYRGPYSHCIPLTISSEA